MDFRTWIRALDARGFHVLAPSHPVPVELWAALPGGAESSGVVQFRCRGTAVTLTRYAVTDLAIVAPADPCECDCARAAAAESTAQRVLVRPGSEPRQVVRWDGRRERGWTGHEAGLLGVAEAAELFDQLLTRLDIPTAALPHPPSPALIGRGAADRATVRPVAPR